MEEAEILPDKLKLANETLSLLSHLVYKMKSLTYTVNISHPPNTVVKDFSCIRGM